MIRHAPLQQRFFVDVHSYTYEVIYTPMQFGGVISHFQFQHFKNGLPSKDPCPLTETGYRSHFFHPSLVDGFGQTWEAAIAAIQSQQMDYKKFMRQEEHRRAAEKSAAQLCLF